MSEDYLQPDDDTAVPVIDPSGEMPGLAGYVLVLKMQRTEDTHTSSVGYRHIKTSEAFTILQHSIVTVNGRKYSSRLPRPKFLLRTVRL
jgi:hypothetical protein